MTRYSNKSSNYPKFIRLYEMLQLSVVGCGLTIVLSAHTANAQNEAEESLPNRSVVIDVDSPAKSQYKIAIPTPLGDPVLAVQTASILKNDLQLISLFQVLDPKSFIAKREQEGLGISKSPWISVGAQGVVKGQIITTGKRIQLTLLFFQLPSTQPSLKHTYQGTPETLRQDVHDFANRILATLTGRAGAFGSKIAFAKRNGPGQKSVYVADFDGHRVGRMSGKAKIAMLPNFGPKGIWYSVLTRRGMYITHSGANNRKIVAGNGLNMGVVQCQGRMIFSSTRHGNSEIYSAKPDGTDVRRLTRNNAIDVSPACSPHGRIAFVSGRHGGAQIFSMNTDGSNVQRLTFRGSHNQTPAWCPDKNRRLLAFSGRDHGFDIFTLDLDTQVYTRVTQGQGTNKDPAFSADCRMLAFASSRGGIYITSPDGDRQQRVFTGPAETLRWEH